MRSDGVAALDGTEAASPHAFLVRTLSFSPGVRLTLLACLLVLTVLSFRVPVTQLDDAFITYRYAQNLVSGHGLVFNPGEYVEGFTNLLWTLLIAAGMRAGFEGEWLGHWLSVVFAAASVFGTYGYAAALLPSRARSLALLAPAALLASNAFVAWMTSGLETPLVLALTVLACWASVTGRRYLSAAICVLAIFTRPEGIILAAALNGADGLRAAAAAWRGTLNVAARLLGPCLLICAGVVALEVFRAFYYGALVPNTFYAKVGGIPVARGVVYLRNFLWDGPMFLLPGTLAAACLVPRFRPAFAFVLLTGAYVVAIGGDVFPVGRFCLPILPALAAGTLAAMIAVLPTRPRAAAALACSIPAYALFSLYGPLQPHVGPPDYDFPHQPAVSFPHSVKRQAARVHWIFAADEDAAIHDQLRQVRALAPRPNLLALIGIGKLGYWGMEFRILDMMGLTDRHIARSRVSFTDALIGPGHSRTDAAYVLSRNPDAIQMPPLEKLAKAPKLPVILDFKRNREFLSLYHFDPLTRLWLRNRDAR